MSQKVNLFLGQVPFTTRVFLCCCSGGAIKTVYSKLPAESWPLSDTISAPAGAQLSSVSASLGAFSFQAEKQATQTNGCRLSCSDRPRSRLAAARQQFRSPTPPKHSSSLHHHYLAYLRALVKCLQFRQCGPASVPR